MLHHTIRRLLELYPRGATNDQLIWRLGASGIRMTASDLLDGLRSLSEAGVVSFGSDKRWRMLQRVDGAAPRSPIRRPPDKTETEDMLYAVPAVCRSRSEGLEVSDLVDEPLAVTALPGWRELLGYYAATQRQDPRGQIAEFPDRHAQSWQLFSLAGRWWGNAEVRVAMDLLPSAFREALARRKFQTAAIGWPVSVFKLSEGTVCMPGFIVPAEWRVDGADLVMLVDRGRPSLNPHWVREVCRNSTWSESALAERLFPEGEDDDLAVVSERLKNALATLGASILRAADLAGEMSLAKVGLRNAAALFLPDDATFTRGAAEDIEAMRDWVSDGQAASVLQKLFSGAVAGAGLGDAPTILSPFDDPLTDSQIEASEAALGGPITLIQGPPGTGKSQVIMALLVSAAMAGKTVLFASRNHQAIDEVEERLAKLVPDRPLLVRGRDAEGDRNTSFLDALNDIAKGEHRQQDGAFDDTRSAILDRAKREADVRSGARVRAGIHLELSELVERLDAIDADRPSHLMTHRSRSIWQRFGEFFARLFRKSRDSGPVPELAPVTKVRKRMRELKLKLEGLGPIAEPSLPGTSPKQIREFLPRLASSVTLPDEEVARHVLDRAKELEFSGVKSARKMSVDDARLVLRHRPIWAISTLSVPSRIPLVPGLFDYVIFDEASQCDIASALPLLGRAKRAVVVGDPEQLEFIPSLGNAAEHALMDAAGLPKPGRSRIAQSRNSLFAFCALRPATLRYFLRDQFRSAPQIVAYLNTDFYRGRLEGRRQEDGFKPPRGYKPGLSWDDVAGVASTYQGGTVNENEAARTVQTLRRIIADDSFSGSVGVISPFNAQVGLLKKTIYAKTSEAERNRLSLRISTVDKFQGGEADVILFSMVLAPGAPQSARTFLQREKRRFNVAISRARAVSIVVGDLANARTCGIRHIESLARSATTPWSPPRPQKHDSNWERRFDTAMKRRGLNPIPQYPVGTRYLDFALDPEGAKLDIEVDGARWHTDSDGNRKVGDRLRDSELTGRGWKVLRFWVHELTHDMEACLDRIERELGRC